MSIILRLTPPLALAAFLFNCSEFDNETSEQIKIRSSFKFPISDLQNVQIGEGQKLVSS